MDLFENLVDVDGIALLSCLLSFLSFSRLESSFVFSSLSACYFTWHLSLRAATFKDVSDCIPRVCPARILNNAHGT